MKKYLSQNYQFFIYGAVVFLVGYFTASAIYWNYQLKKMNKTIDSIYAQVATSEAPKPTVLGAEKTTEVIGERFVGYASFYSEEGCLGCSENQIMANGEKFDETAMTLAFNQLPLNTKVKVTNLTTGDFAYAKVTDRGGFESLNRIADLSLALSEIIGLRTDVDKILIEEVKKGGCR